MSEEEFFNTISSLAKAHQALGQRAFIEFKTSVNQIISTNNQDSQTIESLLDHMLSFCFDEDVLLLYRRLCKHYFPIDPQSTVYYINAYREMFEEDNKVE